MKRKRIVISDWAAMVTVALVIASYIWTLSFNFGKFELRMEKVEQGLHRVEEKVDDLTVEVKTIHVRTNNIERRVDHLEKKSPK